MICRSVRSLSTLEVLHVRDNRLKFWPGGLSATVLLQELRMDNNFIQEVIKFIFLCLCRLYWYLRSGRLLINLSVRFPKPCRHLHGFAFCRSAIINYRHYLPLSVVGSLWWILIWAAIFWRYVSKSSQAFNDPFLWKEFFIPFWPEK